VSWIQAVDFITPFHKIAGYSQNQWEWKSLAAAMGWSSRTKRVIRSLWDTENRSLSSWILQSGCFTHLCYYLRANILSSL
jgi:hypothetical protein